MSSFGCWGLPAALLALLCCPGSGEETFEVHIWPEKLAVETRGSVEVNCSTSCAKPEKIGLETPLNKTLLKYDPQNQWAQFLVSNFSQDTVLLCHFTCNGKQLLKSLRVSVYQLPTQVILKLQPPRVVVGKPFTIECTVPDVKPLESLTLTLLRGKETLQNQTFGGAALAPQDATTTLNSTASTEDRLLSFSCQAELDLRPHGGYIIRSISEPQILEVYALAQDSDGHLQGASCLEEASPGLPDTSCMSHMASSLVAAETRLGLSGCSPALAEGL
uniref:intercellular adhesion molecule 2 isoform X2 n=1 Tax=Jaculus jaculus TaxID=51337 RepID=UPI001E1B2161|nr:intercellular adhesion molecule 2 isoform X2 [Jaculus jaculus]